MPHTSPPKTPQMTDFPQIEVLYEDEDIALINKPGGIVVNKADTIRVPTIQDWWMNRLAAAQTAGLPGSVGSSKTFTLPLDFDPSYGTPEEIFTERGGIVHRLDKETSGVLVLAKHPGSLIHLLAQFRTRQVQKTYQCLVHGRFSITQDTVVLPLARSSHNRVKFAVDPEGRVAETTYAVQEFYPGLNNLKVIDRCQSIHQPQLKRKFHEYADHSQGFSLVTCQPKTGRTHQIRVHMTHIGHPIVADETYLGKKRKELDLLWCPRLFLHASQIELTHPQTGKSLQVSAPLPSDLESALGYLEKLP